MPNDRHDSLSENELKRIIQRAAEIDARRTDELPLERLYSIADELEISRDAVTQALAEAEPPPTRTLGEFNAGGIFKSAVLAGGVGMIAGLLRPFAVYETLHVEALVSVGIIGAVIFLEALRTRTDRPQLSFQLTSLLSWTTYFAAFTVFAPFTEMGDSTGMFAAFAAVSAVVGGLITHLRTSPGADAAPPSAPKLGARQGSRSRRPFAWLTDRWDRFWSRVRLARAI